MVWPFEAKMTGEDNYWGTLLGLRRDGALSARSASPTCTTATDERVAARSREAGLKANLCEGLLAFEPKPYAEYPICAQMRGIRARSTTGPADGRIRIDYNIHAEYTSNPQTCADIAAHREGRTGLRIHLHASETRSEHEECKRAPRRPHARAATSRAWACSTCR